MGWAVDAACPLQLSHLVQDAAARVVVDDVSDDHGVGPMFCPKPGRGISPQCGVAVHEQLIAEHKGRRKMVASNAQPQAFADDVVVYQPPGLEGYSLHKIQQLAKDYFNGDVDGEIKVLLETHCKS